jgi:general secretion pathway protein J
VSGIGGRGGRGFTLIEMVIAIAIMSLILAALYSSFLLADRALVQVDGSSLKLRESRAFVDTLKRELESVRYVRNNAFCVFKMEDRDFYGRQVSSLTMTTVTPLLKGMAKINYAIEERGGHLVMTKSMASAFSPPGAEENRVDLVEDVESFTLEAKYRDTWVKTWDSELTKDAPTEVKIRLTVRINSSRDETSSTVPFALFDTARLMVGRIL